MNLFISLFLNYSTNQLNQLFYVAQTFDRNEVMKNFQVQILNFR